jgi:hypothetical protein
MVPFSKLILFLFILTLGKSPDALREFKQIKGEWIIVSGETGGEKVPSEALAKKVIFMPSAELTKQPENSAAYSGRLRMGHPPNLIELFSISLWMEPRPMSGPARDHTTPTAKPSTPIKQAQRSFALYQVVGDTMKLLLTPGIASHTEPPKDFVTTKEGGELLLELRRIPKKASSQPDKGRK